MSKGFPLILSKLSGFSSPNVAINLRALLKILPNVFKYTTILLLLLNIRSFPLAWHLRVFQPLFALQFRYYLLRLRILFKSRRDKEEEVEKWYQSLAPVGVNPFEAVTIYRTWASLDDSDFNGHLSNSSYAKTYDSARFKMGLAHFPAFFRTGGWMALGATHYHFLREIKMFKKYEVRVRIVGWDNKWLFVIGRYVSHSKVQKPKEKEIETPPADTSLSVVPTFKASLRIPADGFDTPVTPVNSVKSSQLSSLNIGAATEAMKVLAANQLQDTEESDGATLHCIAISQLCFKHGRITVPPGLVLAASGFCAPPPSSPTSDSPSVYSHSNPPPHFSHVKQLISPRAIRQYRGLLRGGWKDIPEAERWWIDALGGVVEERRKANVEGLKGDGPMGALRRGMNGAKSV